MQLTRMFEYDAWANRLEVEHLRTGSTPKALSLLAHIVGTQWVWYARLRDEKPRMPVWPDLTLDDCERSLDLLRGHWAEYLHTAALEETVSYTNTKGEQWSSRVDDVLTHVVLHGAYHRGQIAIVLRGAELTPVLTDYIHCVRSGLI